MAPASAQDLSVAFGLALSRIASYAGQFDAVDIVNNESQLCTAFITRLAEKSPEAFEFNPAIGSTQLVSNFPFHNYEGGRKGRVRFADYALLDVVKSKAAASRSEQASHAALVFVEAKYHFVPGAFRGSSPFKDLKRLATFRRFNERGQKPEGLLAVGFRWSERTGVRDQDGGAVSAKPYKAQEKVFGRIEKVLKSQENNWTTLVYLDYKHPVRAGIPEVRAIGVHADAVHRATRNKRLRVKDSKIELTRKDDLSGRRGGVGTRI